MTPKFVKLHDDAVLPTRANPSDSGMDLYAIEDTILLPGVPTLVRTGLAVQLPEGGDMIVYRKHADQSCTPEEFPVTIEAQIRPRSGLALNHGITVVNSPGTVDNGYRGEIGVILMWRGYKPNAAVMYNDNSSDSTWVQSVESHGNLQYKSEGDRRKEWAYRIRKGDRIAQLVFAQALLLDGEWGEVDATERGDGGFGSTGK